MPDYYCVECSLPSAVRQDLDEPPDDESRCCACGGPVACDEQVSIWNDPAFAELLAERVAQVMAGDVVAVAGFAGALFAPGAAVEVMLLGEL